MKLLLLLITITLSLTSVRSLQSQSTIPINLIRSLEWQPESQYIAFSTQNGIIGLMDSETRRVIDAWATDEGRVIPTVGWNPDGTLLAATGYEPYIIIWDVEDSKIEPSLRYLQQNEPSAYLGWNFDGTYLVTASNLGGAVNVWDVSAEQLLFSPSDGETYAVEWSPHNNIFAISQLSTIQIWDVATQSVLRSIQIPDLYSSKLDWSPDGTKLASNEASTIESVSTRIWDTNTGELLLELKGHTDGIYDLQWSPDGTRLVTTSVDKTVIVWDAATGEILETYNAERAILEAAFSPFGARLAYAASFPPDFIISGQSFEAVEIVVPAPSLMQLNSIQELCLPSEMPVTTLQSTDELPTFVSEIEASPEVSEVCAADLLAVANALLEQ
jgi:WD40 repeat protein